jgi:alpha-L-fucosidase
MYIQGTPQHEFHVKTYGHPSTFGYKDGCHLWEAERWDPEALMKLYKSAGAAYFVVLATHHDNFDCWNSKYQPWNSVQVGPKRDIVGTWAKVARAQ